MSDRHTKRETSPLRYPDGTVYVGHWTRNIYRVNPRGRPATLLERNALKPWIEGRGRHRAGNPFERRPMMVQTCPCQPWRLAR